MNTLKSYLESMFAKMPNTREVLRAKDELWQMMEDKYMELLRQLDVQIIQIATPTWERDFCPAAQSFRQFVTGRCGKRITSSLWLTASTLLGYEKPPETH